MSGLPLRSGPSGSKFTGTPGYVLTLDASGELWEPQPGGGGGSGVTSWNGRDGVVVPEPGDYDISQIGGIGATNGQIPVWSTGLAKWVPTTFAAGGVTSWNTRTGAVVPANGDYTSTQVTNASAVSGATTSDALNTLASSITALTIATAAPLAGGGVVQSGLTLSVATVSNASSGVVPAIGTANGALLANGAGTSSSWALITSVSWVGGLREVADLATRNAIPSANRDVGMTAYEVDTDTTWRLIGGTANANWVDVTVRPASGTAGGTVPTVGALNTVLQSTGSAAIWNANLNLGALPASAGLVRLSAGQGISSLAIDNVSNLSVYKSTTATNNVQTFGDVTSSITQIQGSSAGGVWLLAGNGNQSLTVSSVLANWGLAQMQFAAAQAVTALGVTVNIANLNSGSQAQDLYLRAQGNANAASSGGAARLQGGKPGAGGTKGGGAIQLNADDTTANMQTFVEVREVAAGQRVVSLLFAADATTAFFGSTTGDKVIGIANVATAPTGAPGAGGHLHYSVAGNPAWWTPNGTQTTVGAAGGASALPALPLGYWPVLIQGVLVAIPYYNHP